ERYGEGIREPTKVVDVIDLQTVQTSSRIFAQFHFPVLRVRIVTDLPARNSNGPVRQIVAAISIRRYFHPVCKAVTIFLNDYNFRIETIRTTFIPTRASRVFTRILIGIFIRILIRVLVGIFLRILTGVTCLILTGRHLELTGLAASIFYYS